MMQTQSNGSMNQQSDIENGDQNTGLFNYLVRMTTYPFLHRSSPAPKKFTDLNAYCLSHVFRHLNFRDLIKTRATCRHIRDSIDEYLESKHSFTYDCHLNGIELSAGAYRFNQIAFESALSRMPMLISLSFERCHIMKNILANCQYNLFPIIAEHCRQLHELHLTRSIFINNDSFNFFAKHLFQLTHLSVELFDEKQLQIILTSFSRLQYLNLSNSVLYKIAPILKQNLQSRIRTIILPQDLQNEKLDIINAIGSGNGKNLQRLEMQITISDLNEDKLFFDKLPEVLPKLEWLQLDMRYDGPAHLLHCPPTGDNVENSEDSGVQSPIIDYHSAHRSDLIIGISRLTKLQILILIEADHYDSNRACSLLTDESILPIIRNCSKLSMLSITCGLCRNSINYAPRKFYSKIEAKNINNILYASSIESSSESLTKNSNNHFLKRQESILESDEDDSNSFVSLDLWPHRVGDSSLGLLDHYLFKLRILHLRGVRFGPKTMKSIGQMVNLSRLEHLRIDSVRCSSTGDDALHFTEFMNHIARSRNKTNIHISNIAFL